MVVALGSLVLAAAPLGADQFVAVYGGEGRVLDEGGVFEGGLEWRLAPFFWGVQPILGVLVSDEPIRYGYAGLRREFWFGRFFVAPYSGGGYYDRGGGPNLGGPFQFRSGLEVGRRVGTDWILGAALYHLSNAGTKDPNPGTEAIVLIVSRAVRWSR